MSILELPKRIKQTARTVLQDWLDEQRKKQSGMDALLPEERGILTSLEENGFAIVENFWSREKAFALRDQLLAHLQNGQNKDFECGAYSRFGVANQAYGAGIQRIYHADKLVPELAEFRHHPLPLNIARAYYGMPFHTALAIFQHNPSGTQDGGYHIDGYKKEFKSFLYLDDVTEENGPFTYIRGSHKQHLRRMLRQLQGRRNGSPTNFYKEDVADLLDREVKLTAPAGTLLLADVRGFHFGSPQRNGSRSVLVNYILSEPGEIYIGK